MDSLTRAVISNVTEDNLDIRIQQVTFNKRPSDAEIFFPYGMSGNVPADSLCVVISINNDPGFLVCLPDRSQDRIKGLKMGEVAIFNPLTKSRTIFKENGDIEQVLEGESGSKITVIKNDYSVEVGASTTVNSTGTIDINSETDFTIKSDTKLIVSAPESEFTGNVKITGNLEVVGSTTLGSAVTSGVKDISDTHTHSMGGSGVPN